MVQVTAHLARICLLILVTLFLGARFTARGQTASTVEAYRLQYAGGAKIEQMLSDLLPAVDPESRITRERESRQILVFGTAEAHRIARQVIELADRPGASPEKKPQGETPPRGPVDEQRAAGPKIQHVRLQHAELRHVEGILADIFAARMDRNGGPVTAAPSYTIRASADPLVEPVRLSIDHPRQRITVEGPHQIAAQIADLVRALDSPQQNAGRIVRIVSLRHSKITSIHRAVDAYRGLPVAPGLDTGTFHSREIQSGELISRSRGLGALRSLPPGARRDPRHGLIRFAGMLFDTRGDESARAARDQRASRASRAAVRPTAALQPVQTESGQPEVEPEPSATERLRQLGADVEVETLPDLDVIILRGTEREVEELIKIIQEIERISAENEPEIVVIPLEHVASESLATVIEAIEETLLATRQGQASVTPLVKPNALLVIGWGEALAAIRELAQSLDQPVAPNTQFRVFRLRHAPAATISTTIEGFFEDREGLGTKVRVTADVRSNALVVQAGPRDMAEVELLIRRLDTPQGDTVQELRVFRLKNSLADDIAPILESAIQGAAAGDATTGQPATAGEPKSMMLELLTIDAEGQRLLKSGLLDGVQITPDPRTNTLLVSAPLESMALLAELIRQLDELPAAVAQIKVFRIVNGDAASLVEMLRALLGVPPGGARAQLAGAQGDPSLAPLRFSVDERTNTIIASGSAGDLNIVEAILLRLDEDEVEHRKNSVYRLRNAPAINVANAINDFLRSERQVQQVAPGVISPFRQIEDEVVVVPEPISNSLIFSATPRFFDEIQRLVEELDAQPPQVMIQVLIAEVDLNNIDEFGVELGLQDSILFNRSLLGDLVTTLSSTSTQNAGSVVTTENETIQAASLTPGFGFNNFPLGNSGSDRSLSTAEHTAGQALSSFSVGRINSELGFGGLVLSASSESVSVLIRALQEDRDLRVLSRPQVMTLDNQPAFIQVGERVPRITATQVTNQTIVNSIDLDNVGLILGVTPRISPEGMVVMEVDAERSEVGPIEEGIPVSILETGEVIRSPRIRTTTAQTTVSAASGQTVVLGGLITERSAEINRRVPYLANIPILGHLFRYDALVQRRSELLIILTPRVILNQEDAEMIKQVEAARMHWCAADVHALHGECGICNSSNCEHCDAETRVIYPDLDPHGTYLPEIELEPVPGQQQLQAPPEAPTAPDGVPLSEPLPEPGGTIRFRPAVRKPILDGNGHRAANGRPRWLRAFLPWRNDESKDVQPAAHREPSGSDETQPSVAPLQVPVKPLGSAVQPGPPQGLGAP